MTKKQTQADADYEAEQAAAAAAEKKYPTDQDGNETLNVAAADVVEEYDEEVPARFTNGGASAAEFDAWKAEHCVKPGYKKEPEGGYSNPAPES